MLSSLHVFFLFSYCCCCNEEGSSSPPPPLLFSCDHFFSLFRYAIVAYIDVDQAGEANVLVARSLLQRRSEREDHFIETFDE